LTPVAHVRPHAGAGQLAQLCRGCVGPRPAQVVLQPDDPRDSAAPGELADRFERAQRDRLGHPFGGGPAGGVGEVLHPLGRPHDVPRSPEESDSRSAASACRRTAMTRWTTVTVLARPSAHSTAGRRYGTPRPVSPAATRTVTSRSA